MEIQKKVIKENITVKTDDTSITLIAETNGSFKRLERTNADVDIKEVVFIFDNDGKITLFLRNIELMPGAEHIEFKGVKDLIETIMDGLIYEDVINDLRKMQDMNKTNALIHREVKKSQGETIRTLSRQLTAKCGK